MPMDVLVRQTEAIKFGDTDQRDRNTNRRLNDGIARGDRKFARSASSTESDPAEDREIVV